MRLELLLPPVEPEESQAPSHCPYAGCGGRHFRLHQVVNKPVRDTVCQTVTARRYQCLRCRRTFRVYPTGDKHAPTSQRPKGLAVMLYLLGLSYGAVALALGALSAYLRKSQVAKREAVQAAAKQVPGMKRRLVLEKDSVSLSAYHRPDVLRCTSRI
jgi:hypothetical protein